MTNQKIAFGQQREKFSHLGWFLPILLSAHQYGETFGESVAVPFNRAPSPVETNNDIAGIVRTLQPDYKVILIPNVCGPKRGLETVANPDDREVIQHIAAKVSLETGQYIRW